MRLVVALLSCFACATPVLAQSAGPDRVATGFYKLYLQVKPRGIPDTATGMPFDRFLTPSLSDQIKRAERAEAGHREATQNQEPPLFEGDLFSSLYEGATVYKIDACTVEGARAYCDIDLAFVAEAGAKPTTWTDKLALVKRIGGWRVDDIAFGGAWDFAQHGSLRATLRDVIRSAGE
ncbi:MAG: hypothetical protein WA138_07415 [Parvibaculum sp.]